MQDYNSTFTFLLSPGADEAGLRAKAEGRFSKPDFVYLPSEDVYRCPAGEKLTFRYASDEDGLHMRSYWTTACATCAIKSQCTTGRERRVKRWEHERVVEAVQTRQVASLFRP